MLLFLGCVYLSSHRAHVHFWCPRMWLSLHGFGAGFPWQVQSFAVTQYVLKIVGSHLFTISKKGSCFLLRCPCPPPPSSPLPLCLTHSLISSRLITWLLSHPVPSPPPIIPIPPNDTDFSTSCLISFPIHPISPHHIASYPHPVSSRSQFASTRHITAQIIPHGWCGPYTPQASHPRHWPLRLAPSRASKSVVLGVAHTLPRPFVYATSHSGWPPLGAPQGVVCGVAP